MSNRNTRRGKSWSEKYRQGGARGLVGSPRDRDHVACELWMSRSILCSAAAAMVAAKLVISQLQSVGGTDSFRVSGRDPGLSDLNLFQTASKQIRNAAQSKNNGYFSFRTWTYVSWLVLRFSHSTEC